jgi:signal peptidase II
LLAGEFRCFLKGGRLNTADLNMKHTSSWRLVALALGIVFLDQLTKLLILNYLDFGQGREVVKGFFKLVHFGNTGAAWSMFTGYNGVLAAVAILALVLLYFNRHHFNAHTLGGQLSLGLIFGGIIGNLIDRVLPSRHHVIDFLYFYVVRRNGEIASFPAFNVADSAICVGVGLLFILSWQHGPERTLADEPRP